MTNQIDESQFKLVAELLKRQDDALEQLETLCNRVEQAIEDNVGPRENDEGVPDGQTTDVDEAGQSSQNADSDATERSEHAEASTDIQPLENAECEAAGASAAEQGQQDDKQQVQKAA